MDRDAQRRGETYSGVKGIADAGCVAAGEHGADRRPHARSGWYPRTAASSWPGASSGGPWRRSAEEGVMAARGRCRAPDGTVSRRRAAEGPVLHRRERRGTGGRARARSTRPSEMQRHAHTAQQLRARRDSRGGRVTGSATRNSRRRGLPGDRAGRAGGRASCGGWRGQAWNGGHFLVFDRLTAASGRSAGSLTACRRRRAAAAQRGTGRRRRRGHGRRRPQASAEAASIIGNACAVQEHHVGWAGGASWSRLGQPGRVRAAAQRNGARGARRTHGDVPELLSALRV